MRMLVRADAEADPVGYVLSVGFPDLIAAEAGKGQETAVLQQLLRWLQQRPLDAIVDLAATARVSLQGYEEDRGAAAVDASIFALLSHCLSLPAVRRPQALRVLSHRLGLGLIDCTTLPEVQLVSRIHDAIALARERALTAARFVHAAALPPPRSPAGRTAALAAEQQGAESWLGASLDRLAIGAFPGASPVADYVSAAARDALERVSDARASLGLPQEDMPPSTGCPLPPLLRLVKNRTGMGALLGESAKALVATLACRPAVLPGGRDACILHAAGLQHAALSSLLARAGVLTGGREAGTLYAHAWLHALMQCLCEGPRGMALVLPLLQAACAPVDGSTNLRDAVSCLTAGASLRISDRAPCGEKAGIHSGLFALALRVSAPTTAAPDSRTAPLESWLDTLVVAVTGACVSSVAVRVAAERATPDVNRAVLAWTAFWRAQAVATRSVWLVEKDADGRMRPSWAPNDGPRSSIIAGLCGLSPVGEEERSGAVTAPAPTGLGAPAEATFIPPPLLHVEGRGGTDWEQQAGGEEAEDAPASVSAEVPAAVPAALPLIPGRLAVRRPSGIHAPSGPQPMPWWADVALLLPRADPGVAALWGWLGCPGWLWTIGVERRALARSAGHPHSGSMPAFSTSARLVLRVPSSSSPVSALQQLVLPNRDSVGPPGRPLLLVAALSTPVYHLDVTAQAGVLSPAEGGAATPAPQQRQSPATPTTAAQVRTALEGSMRRLVAASLPMHVEGAKAARGGPPSSSQDGSGPVPVVLVNAAEDEEDAGTPVGPSPAPLGAPPHPTGPAFVMPIDRHLYTAPFVHAPTVFAAHPSEACYARAGPGGAVAAITVSLEPAGPGRVQHTHALGAVYGYEPVGLPASGSGEKEGGFSLFSKKGAHAPPTTHTTPGLHWDEHVTSIRWAPDGGAILTSFASGIVRCWDAGRSVRPKVTLQLADGRAGRKPPTWLTPGDQSWAASDALALSGSASVLAVSGAPLFAARSIPAIAAAQARIEAGAPRGGAAAGRSVGALLAAGGLPSGPCLSIFDVRTGSAPAWSGLPFPSFPGFTALLPDEPSLTLIAGAEDGSLLFFDLRRLALRHVIQGVPLAAASPLSGGSSGSWEAGGGTAGGVGHYGHAGAVRTLAMHPSRRQFASGGADGDVRLWSLPDAEAVTSIPRAHTGRLRPAISGPTEGGDGGLVGALPLALTGLAWEAGAWGEEVLRPAPGARQSGGVSALAITEEHVVSGGADGSITAHAQLW
jgi:hypothetical protein